MKKQVGTIDITLTWVSIMPMLIYALENGTETGKRMAEEELMRLASVADAYNALEKAKNDAR